MKEKILIFSIGKSDYKNYDKSSLLDAFIKYNEKDYEFYTVLFDSMSNITKEYYKSKINVHTFKEFKFMKDKRTYNDVNSCLEYMYKIFSKKNLMYSQEFLMYDNVILYSKFYDYILEEKFSKIIVWGNALLPKIIIKVAKRLNIPHVILEEGYFRNYGIQASPIGSNYQGEIIEEYFLHKQSNVTLSSNFAFRFYDMETLNNNMDKYCFDDQYVYDNIESLKFVFIPMQINTDTQIIINSPYVDNMFDLTKNVVNMIRQYNINNNEKLCCIFKVHPEHEKQDSLDNFEYIYNTFSSEDHGIFFTKYLDLNAHLYFSEAVITVNSTVGFEALTFGKKVLTLGNAIYGVNDVSFNVNSYDEMLYKFNEMMRYTLNKVEIARYLNFVKDRHLVIDLKDPSKESVGKIFDLTLNFKNKYLQVNDYYYKTNHDFVDMIIKDFEDDYFEVKLNNVSLIKVNIDRSILSSIKIYKFPLDSKNRIEVNGVATVTFVNESNEGVSIVAEDAKGNVIRLSK